MIVNPELVKRFLEDFKTKLSIWGVLFRDDRGKNAQAILLLEISTVIREQILKELKVEDYCEGPLDDILYGGASMWVFGKIIKSKTIETEVYIKITMGSPGSRVICISFHLAAHKMKYPLK